MPRRGPQPRLCSCFVVAPVSFAGAHAARTPLLTPQRYQKLPNSPLSRSVISDIARGDRSNLIYRLRPIGRRLRNPRLPALPEALISIAFLLSGCAHNEHRMSGYRASHSHCAPLRRYTLSLHERPPAAKLATDPTHHPEATVQATRIALRSVATLCRSTNVRRQQHTPQTPPTTLKLQCTPLALRSTPSLHSVATRTSAGSKTGHRPHPPP